MPRVRNSAAAPCPRLPDRWRRGIFRPVRREDPRAGGGELDHHDARPVAGSCGLACIGSPCTYGSNRQGASLELLANQDVQVRLGPSVTHYELLFVSGH